ncbi:LysR family transcriptional regulator [Enterobacteriaceae bacterium RIT691]|nr:LysR family transcriptional regulator [Enterobacteriaceae bacterium RIT691]
MPKRTTDELADLKAFAAVAHAGGFREAARLLQLSPSGLSDAVRRLETSLGVRLLHRTTRSVMPTEQGSALLTRIRPAFDELELALKAVTSSRDKPAGNLRLNVPVNATRLFLAPLLTRFLQRYPDITVEVIAETGVVDILAAGCDAGIRYDDRLEQDTIAVPIGPREQRFATAAAPELLDRYGRPQHPQDLLKMPCIRGRFAKGNLERWCYQRGDEQCHIDPHGPLIYSGGSAVDMGVSMAVQGIGVMYLFEAWLQPWLDSGELEPILEPWWQRFNGPFLYYSGRTLVPAPLRAFIDFVREDN